MAATLDQMPKSSVRIGGKCINLSAISREQGIHASYLSRIIAGKRSPSLQVSKKLANALQIGLDELVKLLDSSKAA